MNFVIVTLLTLGAQPVPPGASYLPPPQAMGGGEHYECNCDACRAHRAGPGIAGRIGAAYHNLAHKVATCAMEPQTNYNPRFGCYGSNDRYMHRYPAFHGHYYRRPYNYRTEFDYPWHAEMHEPTSLFSYNFANEGEGGQGGPREPLPAARSNQRDPRAGNSPRPTTIRSAAASQSVTIRPVPSSYNFQSDDVQSPSDRR